MAWPMKQVLHGLFIVVTLLDLVGKQLLLHFVRVSGSQVLYLKALQRLFSGGESHFVFFYRVLSFKFMIEDVKPVPLVLERDMTVYLLVRRRHLNRRESV